MSGDDTLSRLDALEIRIAHQDATIDDLNNTIIAQWKQIDRLTEQLTRLRDLVVEARDGQAGLPEKPPPHY